MMFAVGFIVGLLSVVAFAFLYVFIDCKKNGKSFSEVLGLKKKKKQSKTVNGFRRR